MECVHEPCTLLKYTTNMAENHPHGLDETPVLLRFMEGERRKKNKKSFWKWSALHFPQSRAAKHDLAEKDYQRDAGLYRKIITDGKIIHMNVIVIQVFD